MFEYIISIMEQNYKEYEYLKEIALKFEELSNYPLIYTNEPSRDFLFAVNWEKEKDPKILTP